MSARSLLLVVVVVMLLLLHFLSFFLFCQAEKQPVGPFYALRGCSTETKRES